MNNSILSLASQAIKANPFKVQIEIYDDIFPCVKIEGDQHKG